MCVTFMLAALRPCCLSSTRKQCQVMCCMSCWQNSVCGLCPPPCPWDRWPGGGLNNHQGSPESKTQVYLWLWQESSLLVPAKVLPTHLVEMAVKWPVKVSESLQNFWGDLGMGSTLGLSKATRSAAPLWFLQARETFGLIEVEVFVWNDSFKTQEVLNPSHFPSWIRNKPLATNK